MKRKGILGKMKGRVTPEKVDPRKASAVVLKITSRRVPLRIGRMPPRKVGRKALLGIVGKRARALRGRVPQRAKERRVKKRKGKP